jgi:hypothetical protein
MYIENYIVVRTQIETIRQKAGHTQWVKWEMSMFCIVCSIKHADYLWLMKSCAHVLYAHTHTVKYTQDHDNKKFKFAYILSVFIIFGYKYYIAYNAQSGSLKVTVNNVPFYK